MNRHFILGVFAAVIIVLFGACDHGLSSIGLGLNGHLVGTTFTDTVTVEAYSFLEDTINTKNLSANLVGEIHDPVFGDNRATIYSQFSLSGSSVNFGNNPTIDSVVLTMQLASYYGDTTSKVAIRIYELEEALSKDNKYYQNSTLAHSSNALNYSMTSYPIYPTSEVIVDTGAYSPHIRIRLSNAFGQYLLDHQSEMHSANAFKDFFKGLCITATGHTGNTGYMLLTNLNSSLSGIVLYYHNDRKASAKYTFPCNSNCVRFNNYTHDYNASTNNNFSQEVLAGQQEIGKQQLFLQATGGVKTRITFPYLEKFIEPFKAQGSRIVVNRAELVITDVSPEEVYLVHPAALSLQGFLKSNGTVSYIPDDDYYTSASYYGGTYDASKHEYRFRVTSYVQGLISGDSKLTNALNLVVKGSGVRANRLVFGGTGLGNDQRLRLEIAYTTY